MLIKMRREAFGGIIFAETPGFVSYVNNSMADCLGIKKKEGIVFKENIYSSPLDAHFAVTTKCNMYCKGCYNTVKSDEKKDIDFDKAKRIIDNLASLSVLSVSFGGGEPTLYPHIIELAEYTRSRNILPNITTNGLTMTDDFAKKCIVFGNVHFSIHKPEDIETAFNAAEIYKNNTRKKAGLNLLITKETYPLLEQIVKRANKSAFKKILFLRYKQTKKNMDTEGLNADDLIKNALLKIKELSRHSRLMFLFDCSVLQEIASLGLIPPRRLERVDANGCMGANAYIAIDADGMYKPCSFWNETFGDAQTLDYNEWIKSSKLNEFRSFKCREHCNACDYSKVCNNGCRLDYLSCSYK